MTSGFQQILLKRNILCLSKQALESYKVASQLINRRTFQLTVLITLLCQICVLYRPRTFLGTATVTNCWVRESAVSQ